MEVDESGRKLVYNGAPNWEVVTVDSETSNAVERIVASLDALELDDLNYLADWLEAYKKAGSLRRDVMIGDIRPSLWNLDQYEWLGDR